MDELIERIKMVYNEFSESKSEASFAKEVGLTQSAINLYFSGKRKISMTFVMQLLNRYPDLSAEWLLRGEGEMLKGSVPQTALVDLESEYNRGFHDGVCSVTGFRSQKNASGV